MLLRKYYVNESDNTTRKDAFIFESKQDIIKTYDQPADQKSLGCPVNPALNIFCSRPTFDLFVKTSFTSRCSRTGKYVQRRN